MLIKQSFKDVETTANGVKGTMRVYIIEPNVPEYPDAKFPGCVVFSEVCVCSLSQKGTVIEHGERRERERGAKTDPKAYRF